MARFIESPELFGSGIGSSTTGKFTCAFCGMAHNMYKKHNEDSIAYTFFAGRKVCGFCFEDIENEILHRMPDIAKWYAKLVKTRKKIVNDMDKNLEKVQGGFHAE